MLKRFEKKATSESISKVLYPNDETESGKELRLVQQYFFVACSIRDMIARFEKAMIHGMNFRKKWLFNSMTRIRQSRFWNY